ncbi:SDR family NAD(P)-dependent oxidoreductase [Hymenobacter setariae]|uniref:SDR family NAD(P)-dependent oxidoreductase n=1 Tax=Hymenobacter setariae TaxID=2594794 RepID=A0A558BS36_9BACT|nr:oxidoreductase [Hymenobacter setariae]TVT39337.1 SDR family NAD(P)-dependent oxidoreductase [Hymenobacter setariae]
MTKHWFITGVSTGLGKHLAELALRQGDKVAATFREQSQADAFSQVAGDNGLGLLADVTNEAQVKAAVAAAIAHLGHLDVVVNNAGYGSLGPIEEIDDAEVQRQFDSNVFGPLRVIRAVLPHLRERKSGHILNVTSLGGLTTFPSTGIYHGSKFALEGIGESLAQQVGPLGIHVTNVEPSSFRTDWAGRSATYTPVQIADYEPTVGKAQAAAQANSGRQPGDPDRAAQAMFDLVRMENPPLHLPLGKRAVQQSLEKFTAIKAEIEQYAHIGNGADFPDAS